MAILITRKDCSISDTDKPFYRVESSNLGVNGFAGYALTFPVNCTSINFANAGNCKGFGLFVASGNNSQNYGLFARLEASMGPCTMTVATPCVVTRAAHGLITNDRIAFSKTGTLPTGVNDNSIFYVQNPSTNSFNISGEPDGSIINTSGTQSGAHTLWKVLDDASIEWRDIVPDASEKRGYFTANFDFTRNASVETGLNKYRIYSNHSTGTTGGYAPVSSMYAAITGALNYWVWNDASFNFSNNDVPIIRHYCTIDTSCVFGTHIPQAAQYAAASITAYICSNPKNISAETNSYLKWENPPKSSYTLNMNGSLVIGSFGGITIGSSDNRIPYEKQAIIDASNGVAIRTWGTSYTTGLGSLQFWGQEPSIRIANIIVDAAAGQKVVRLDTDVSGYWLKDDYVFIGPLNYGANTTSYYKIDAVDGSTVTLTTNLTYKALAGGVVVAGTRYGIWLYGRTLSGIAMPSPLYCIMKGTRTTSINLSFPGANYPTPYIAIDGNYARRHEFEGNAYWGAYGGGVWQANYTPQEGLSIIGNVSHATTPFGVIYNSVSSSFKSGDILVKDNTMFSSYSNIISATYAVPGTTKNMLFENNKFYNINSNVYYVLGFGGSNNVYRNNDYYGIYTTTYSGIYLYSLSDSQFYNNTYNYNYKPYLVVTNAFLNNIRAYNERYGNLTANTYDFTTNSGAYIDWINISPSTAISFTNTNYDLCISSSKFRVTNENTIANADTTYCPYGVIKRTGDGLTDTTVHISGTGKFAMRFEPLSSIYPLEWSQYIPTGNIQNLTMNISVWVKINSSTYFAGTHQKPRLTVDYDNGTTAYTEAIASTGWQLLSLSFTPSTTYGQVKATISGYTDATSSDSWFYVDDLNIFYPPGIQIALGGLDLWADGLPITPSISTGVNAADVWNILSSMVDSSGTMGNKLNYINTTQNTLVDINTNIKKLNLNKATRSGNIITIYEDDASTIWKNYDLSNNGRAEL
jgi:hypothetical protein